MGIRNAIKKQMTPGKANKGKYLRKTFSITTAKNPYY